MSQVAHIYNIFPISEKIKKICHQFVLKAGLFDIKFK